MEEAHFGPAGNSQSFEERGYKKSSQIPAYLKSFGLNAFEFQCGHGMRVNWESVRELGRLCQEAGISLSLHTPYYISLSSLNEETRLKSVGYLLDAARIVDALGGRRMVVHSGSCGKQSRENALLLSSDTLVRARVALDEAGYSEVLLCPETMGKVNQLGTLEEVVELCRLDERFYPCVDFGHLNARTFGGLKGKNDFLEILNTIENGLGQERLKHFHAHFSKIEYGEPGGEKRHLTFSDAIFGPEFEPLMELIAQKGLAPTIICESAGTQAEDASTMRQCYLSHRGD